jgi:hypothetical protein
MVVKDVPLELRTLKNLNLANLFGLSVFYFDAYSFSFSHNVYYFYFFTLRGGSGGECIGLDVFKRQGVAIYQKWTLIISVTSI